MPEAAVEAARTAARLHSTTEPPPHENGEVCCGECGEAIAYPGCTAEETSERAWRHAYRAALTAALPFLTAAPSKVERIARTLAETTALSGADAHRVVQAAQAMSAPSATRDEVARLIDPSGWRYFDTGMFPPDHPASTGIVHNSRETADALLARFTITPKEDR